MAGRRGSCSNGKEGGQLVVAAGAKSRDVFEEGACAGMEAAVPSQRTIVATHPISQRPKAYSKEKRQLERKEVK